MPDHYHENYPSKEKIRAQDADLAHYLGNLGKKKKNLRLSHCTFNKDYINAAYAQKKNMYLA